jgi:hypothetical protein
MTLQKYLHDCLVHRELYNVSNAYETTFSKDNSQIWTETEVMINIKRLSDTYGSSVVLYS